MSQFRDILLALHGENKKMLRNLYVDRQVYISSLSSSMQPVEDEKCFEWHDLRFRFMGTGMRRPERMNLLIFIPEHMVEDVLKTSGQAENAERVIPKEAEKAGEESVSAEVSPETRQPDRTACEDFLLRTLSPLIMGVSEELENDRKDSREQAKFETQAVSECIRKRSGMLYSEDTGSYVLRILFWMPLINGTTVDAKKGFRAVRMILETVETGILRLDREAFAKQIRVYRHQEEIREWLAKNRAVAFVADGSILPRQGGSTKTMTDAVPFCSPESLRQTVRFADGTAVSGMVLPEGVTVITGGGYSGKSTLLDALETGIYHHIPGDGREYVVSLPDTAKIYAEDGRPVRETDLSLFFQDGMVRKDFRSFETDCASGSVSQATNILEAVYAGTKTLLIDEDTSATNFMIRDDLIRKLVQKEPIIPFTDRVRELYAQAGVSTILVIGGSGEYLQHADRCLLMEDYRIRDVTEDARRIAAVRTEGMGQSVAEERTEGIDQSDAAVRTEGINQSVTVVQPENIKRAITVGWENAMVNQQSSDGIKEHLLRNRYFHSPETSAPFYISRLVSVDQARFIQIDRYSSDVTKLTALETQEQLQTLTFLLERCFVMTSATKTESSETCLEAGTGAERMPPSPPEYRDLADHMVSDLFTEALIDKIQSDNYQFTLWLEEIRPMELLGALFRLRESGKDENASPCIAQIK